MEEETVNIKHRRLPWLAVVLSWIMAGLGQIYCGRFVKEAVTKNHGPRTVYRKGAIIRPDSYNPDPFIACSNGIHFFISKQEALDWES